MDSLYEGGEMAYDEMACEMMEAPADEEKPKDEIRDFSTCLMVFSSQDDNMHLLDKIFSSKEWQENTDA
jgi:hypothetical protein